MTTQRKFKIAWVCLGVTASLLNRAGHWEAGSYFFGAMLGSVYTYLHLVSASPESEGGR